MKVCVGGTFDFLHAGHKKLIEKAFETGDEVYIGLTSDCLIKKKKRVRPYTERLAGLETYLKKKKYRNYKIVPLGRNYGIADSANFDAIVVSEETNKVAVQINRVRKRHGLKPLAIITVDKVYAEDLIPISSTRIRNSEIDCKGKRLVPLKINIGSINRNKVNAVKNVFSQLFGDAKFKIVFKGIKVTTHVKDQPFEKDTIKGAIARAKLAIRNADIGVGIEAGLFWNRYLKKYMDVQYCVFVDKTGKMTIGHGGGFIYPNIVIKEILKGASVSEAFSIIYSTPDMGEKEGAIGYLSKGFITREQLSEQAVILAIIPRLAGRIGI